MRGKLKDVMDRITVDLLKSRALKSIEQGEVIDLATVTNSATGQRAKSLTIKTDKQIIRITDNYFHNK